ncbi:MAG: PIN domain-containing protein [Phenylobacterium sp.]|nr:MAG: PIN domain-containing protein [Phenylobacterium sp.]
MARRVPRGGEIARRSHPHGRRLLRRERLSQVIAVDASAVLAVFFGEAEERAFRSFVARRGGGISAVNHWEVLARAYSSGGAVALRAAEALLAELRLEVIAASDAHSRGAVAAFQRFGKGVGGPLNLGDCFAYALAQIEGDGLLYKGEDFAKTDVKSALT